jgi:hypothetical protein
MVRRQRSSPIPWQAWPGPASGPEVQREALNALIGIDWELEDTMTRVRIPQQQMFDFFLFVKFGENKS